MVVLLQSKQGVGVPVPTEQYRSYRRAPPGGTPGGTPARPPPDPTQYIHASNPNLLDFEKTDFVAKPPLQVPKPKPKVSASTNRSQHFHSSITFCLDLTNSLI